MVRSAVIVGGAGGIGRACGAVLKRDGYGVRVVDRSLGHDATDVAALTQVIGKDPVSLLVHAAGSVGAGGLTDGSVAEWRRVLDDNLVSAMVALHVVEPLLVDDASVVLLSSVNGRHGGNALSGPAYAAAKSGVIGLARNAAKELSGRGIRVNAIAPGPVNTSMLERLGEAELAGLRASVPLGRFAEPEEIAETVGWLASPATRSITGAVIDVNGGMWMG